MAKKKVNEIPFLNIYKTKDWWICEDKEGRSARGLTKQHALNCYYIENKIEPPSVFPVELSDFNTEIKKDKTSI